MRSYYAIIGDRPYELPKLTLTKASKVLGEEQDHTEVVSRPDVKTLAVNVTVADLTRETWTNKQLADMFKNFLREKKITQLTKLSDCYTVYVAYHLWDDICGECIDSGIGTKEVRPEVFQFPLGLNEENEYVARLGFTLSASITQRYRPKTSYGMMRPTTTGTEYSLVIDRIWITQLMSRAWSLCPDHVHTRPHTHYHHHQHCGGCVNPDVQPRQSTMAIETAPAWGKPYGFHDPECGTGSVIHSGGKCVPAHPSANDKTCCLPDRVYDPRDLCVIYDSADTVSEFMTVPITFAPQEITINFNAKTISPILIHQDEVTELLEGIRQEIIESDKPPVKPPVEGGENTNPPLAGEEGDQKPPTGGGSSSGDTGTGDGTEGGGSSSTDPIEGDDKDHTTKPDPETENPGETTTPETPGETTPEEGTETV